MDAAKIRAELKKRGKNQKDAAQAIGLDESKFSKTLANNRQLKAKEADALRNWLKQTPMLQEEPRSYATPDSPSPGYFDVPVFDIGLWDSGAGGDDAMPDDYLKLRSQWLQTLTRVPAKLVAWQVHGDMMWETLHDGDHTLIDTSLTNPRREGIYGLLLDGLPELKRISMHPVTKLLTLKCDNPIYPTFENIVPEDLTVVGRVVWIGKRM